MTARLNNMGEVVYRYSEIEEALIDLMARRDYYPSGGGASEFFTAEITGGAPVLPNRWAYTANKLDINGVSVGAITGSILNLAENGNTATTINYGQGVSSDANSSISVLQIATGSRVVMYKFGNTYLFEASPNPITVTCISAAGDGACCEGTPTPACTQKTQANCTGAWTAATPCLPDPCTGGSGGACCHADGTCSDVANAGACAGVGGVYQGDGTLCSGVSCPASSLGACCQGQTCVPGVTGSACIGAGGSFVGVGTTCSPNPCLVFIGACCEPGGACSVGTQNNCISLGGVYQGDNSTCTPNPCGPATGACCNGGIGGCQDNVLQTDCVGAAHQFGTYLGDGTTCAVDGGACP